MAAWLWCWSEPTWAWPSWLCRERIRGTSADTAASRQAQPRQTCGRPAAHREQSAAQVSTHLTRPRPFLTPEHCREMGWHCPCLQRLRDGSQTLRRGAPTCWCTGHVAPRGQWSLTLLIARWAFWAPHAGVQACGWTSARTSGPSASGGPSSPKVDCNYTVAMGSCYHCCPGPAPQAE